MQFSGYIPKMGICKRKNTCKRDTNGSVHETVFKSQDMSSFTRSFEFIERRFKTFRHFGITSSQTFFLCNIGRMMRNKLLSAAVRSFEGNNVVRGLGKMHFDRKNQSKNVLLYQPMLFLSFMCSRADFTICWLHKWLSSANSTQNCDVKCVKAVKHLIFLDRSVKTLKMPVWNCGGGAMG